MLVQGGSTPPKSESNILLILDKNTEVVSVSGDSGVCNNFANYSSPLVGVLLNGSTPFVCNSTTCFVPGQEEDSSVEIYERKEAAGTLWDDNTLWLTGGKVLKPGPCYGDPSFDYTSTSILIKSDGSKTPGPLLPQEMSGHCIARFNETVFLFFGSRRIYFYVTRAVGEGYWTSGPTLIPGINHWSYYYQACGFLLQLD